MERIKDKIDSIYSDEFDGQGLGADDLSKFGLTAITLRPYQLAGVNWMLERYIRGHGCILGDEMGLGKTCQTISVLVALAGTGESSGPHLLLSPLSVLDNWKTELKKFAPSFKYISYIGDKDTREGLRKKIRANRSNISIILTTYEICLKDEFFLRQFSWNTLVVDEAHRLKNRESLLHQALLEFDIRHHILLTGTPVQNNLRELYALLCLVAPSIFKYRYCDAFVDAYADVDSKSAASELHQLLQPFLLRRVKSQVLKDLPKRSEVILFHGLSALQKKIYKAILTKDSSVFERNGNVAKTRLLNVLMNLRKCVNHPYLFDGIEPEPFELGEHLVDVSGKLVLVDELLAYLRPRGHKVLIFSQMTHMLDIVQDYLGYRGYSYERLDGSVRGEERYLAIKNFNTDESTFIFLLSTRAGGVGLNLTAADTVLFLDSDFNPQNDLQAAARAHRIGQQRPVKIVRLIGRSTVEEIVLRRAEAKLKLTETVIEGEQFAHGVSSEDKTALVADTNLELQDILKFGLDKLLANDDSTVESVDFDAILGPTVNSQWSEVEDKETQATLAAETMAIDDLDLSDEEDDEGKEERSRPAKEDNMYKYEGTDYSQQPSAADKKAAQLLLQNARTLADLEGSAEDGDGRALRRSRTTLLAGELPETTRKPRVPLTAEQIEQRNKKRAETLARKAKQAEEEERRREEKRLQRRDALWKAHNYVSCSLDFPEEEADDIDEEILVSKDEGEYSRDINYVTGDVTYPQNAVEADAIVVHCVDDSGGWGTGGLFSALSNRAPTVEEQYELAGKVKDLRLGDAHLVAIDDHPSRLKGSDYVALVVAQQRDRHGNLSGIKLSALKEGLQKISACAKEKKASVHLPRIGYATPGFNWYGTERLIRKHLSAQGIPTYVYYYKRRQAVKRASSESPQPSTSKVDSEEEQDDRPEVKKPRRDNNGDLNSSSSSTAGAGKSSSAGTVIDELPDFMQGVAVVFLGLPATMERTLTRYIIAYDGDVHAGINDCTTHLVVMDAPTPQDRKEIRRIVDAYPDVSVVKTSWLAKCFIRQRKVDASRHLMTET